MSVDGRPRPEIVNALACLFKQPTVGHEVLNRLVADFK